MESNEGQPAGAKPPQRSVLKSVSRCLKLLLQYFTLFGIILVACLVMFQDKLLYHPEVPSRYPH